MNFLEEGQNVLFNLDQYYHQSVQKNKRVLRQPPIAEIHEHLKLKDHLEKGDLNGKRLDHFLKTYLDYTTRLHHPGYLAHQVGVPHAIGALASLVDGFTNNPMAIYEMGPGAAAIEFFMINLLLEKVGWEPMPSDIEQRRTYSHGGGVLTHGGSLANMTVLLTARNRLDGTIRENGMPSDLVVLAPESSHYSIAKAAGIIGIGEHNVIKLATDAHGRVWVSKLEAAFQKAVSRGKRIVALVANACSTGLGLYDPLDEIADFCIEKGIWFHVDGAHGAGVLFSRKYRGYLEGIQKADSMILDAHKMLRTPSICASLLVKEAADLDSTFEHRASYIFHEKKQPGFDFIQQTIECTKAGLGLKFYMTLAAMGEKGVGAYIDRAYGLARQVFELLDDLPDFEVPCRPESNILCFRYNAPDAVQLILRDRLIEEGRFYLSSTQLNGRRYLRMVILNPETRIEDIRDLVESIRRVYQKTPPNFRIG